MVTTFHICPPISPPVSAHQDDLSVPHGTGSSISELIALQSVFGKVLGNVAGMGCQFVQSEITSNPDVSPVVFGDAGYAVVGKSLGGGVDLRLDALFEVVAQSAIFCSEPYPVLAVHEDTVRETVLVQTVDALEGREPAVVPAVETCQSDGGSSEHLEMPPS